MAGRVGDREDADRVRARWGAEGLRDRRDRTVRSGKPQSPLGTAVEASPTLLNPPLDTNYLTGETATGYAGEEWGARGSSSRASTARAWRPARDYDGLYNPHKGFPYGRAESHGWKGGVWSSPVAEAWQGITNQWPGERRERGGTRVSGVTGGEDVDAQRAGVQRQLRGRTAVQRGRWERQRDTVTLHERGRYARLRAEARSRAEKALARLDEETAEALRTAAVVRQQRERELAERRAHTREAAEGKVRKTRAHRARRVEVKREREALSRREQAAGRPARRPRRITDVRRWKGESGGGQGGSGEE